MFALTRKETDRGKTTTKRKTLRREWLLHTLRMRRWARVVHTLGHTHRHSISGTPSLNEAANKVPPHVNFVLFCFVCLATLGVPVVA